jgi:hypothetical protein
MSRIHCYYTLPGAASVPMSCGSVWSLCHSSSLPPARLRITATMSRMAGDGEKSEVSTGGWPFLPTTRLASYEALPLSPILRAAPTKFEAEQPTKSTD